MSVSSFVSALVYWGICANAMLLQAIVQKSLLKDSIHPLKQFRHVHTSFVSAADWEQNWSRSKRTTSVLLLLIQDCFVKTALTHDKHFALTIKMDFATAPALLLFVFPWKHICFNNWCLGIQAISVCILNYINYTALSTSESLMFALRWKKTTKKNKGTWNLMRKITHNDLINK